MRGNWLRREAEPDEGTGCEGQRSQMKELAAKGSGARRGNWLRREAEPDEGTGCEGKQSLTRELAAKGSKA